MNDNSENTIKYTAYTDEQIRKIEISNQEIGALKERIKILEDELQIMMIQNATSQIM